MKDSLAMSIPINSKLVNDDKPVAAHHGAESKTNVLVDNWVRLLHLSLIFNSEL